MFRAWKLNLNECKKKPPLQNKTDLLYVKENVGKEYYMIHLFTCVCVTCIQGGDTFLNFMNDISEDIFAPLGWLGAETWF